MHMLPRNPRFDALLEQARETARTGRESGKLPDYPTFVDRLFKQIVQFDMPTLVRVMRETAGEGGLIDANVFAGRLAELAEGNPDGSAMHAAVGLAGEGGESLDCVKKVWIYGKTWDQVDPKTDQTPLENLLEELANHRFYYRKLLNMLGLTDEDVEAYSYHKLSKRYASGTYSDAQAQARADKDVPPKAGHIGDRLPSPGATPRTFMGKPAALQNIPKRRASDAEDGVDSEGGQQ